MSWGKKKNGIGNVIIKLMMDFFLEFDDVVSVKIDYFDFIKVLDYIIKMLCYKLEEVN